MVQTASRGVSGAPSEAGEGELSLHSTNGGGGSGGSDSVNNAVGSGNVSALASPFSQDCREGTGGGREGESAPLSPAPSYFTSTSDSGEGVAQPILPGRDRHNLEWREGLSGLTAGRTRGETRVGALLVKLKSVREKMYAFLADNAPFPGESEFGSRSPIGLHVGQAECIPQNWSKIKKFEFYEEWLSAMRLELEEHNEVDTF